MMQRGRQSLLFSDYEVLEPFLPRSNMEVATPSKRQSVSHSAPALGDRGPLRNARRGLLKPKRYCIGTHQSAEGVETSSMLQIFFVLLLQCQMFLSYEPLPYPEMCLGTYPYPD